MSSHSIGQTAAASANFGINEIRDTVQEMTQRLVSISEELSNSLDRLYGSVPEPVSAKEPQPPVNVRVALANLRDALNVVEDKARRISAGR